MFFFGFFMGKMLFRKMIRDLRINFVQFLAIFIMCFFAMMVLTGLTSETEGCKRGTIRYYEETNFLDLYLTSDGFTENDLVDVKAIADVEDATMRANIVGNIVISGEDKKIGMMFTQGNEVSKMLLLEGKEYKPGDTGIWIDWHFAERQRLAVGDNVTLKYNGVTFTETIRGIMDQPDFMTYVVDDTFTGPTYGEYAYAIMDAGEYPGKDIVYDRIDIKLKSVDSVLRMTDLDNINIERAKQEIVSTLNKPSLAAVSKIDEKGYSDIETELYSMNVMLSTVFPGLFIMVALLGVITTMTRMMSRQRTLIGALKALGFSKWTIIFHYMSYIGVIAAAGCVTGSVLGYYIMGVNFMGGMQEYYTNPYLELVVAPIVVYANIFIVVASMMTAYISCRNLLAQNASDILRPEAPKNANAGVFEKFPFWKKLSFASRWNLRDINQNKLRSVAGVLGVTLCSALIFSAFAYNDSNHFMETWMYDELTPSAYSMRFKSSTDYGTVYDYARQFNGQMIEETEVEMKSDTVTRMYGLTVVDEGNLYRFEDLKGEYTDLRKDGVAISDKASLIMQVEVGDMIRFRIPGQKKWYSQRVVMVYKTNGTQGVSITRDDYTALGLEFEPNMLYTNMTVPDSYIERKEITEVGSKQKYLDGLKKRGQHVDDVVYMIMAMALIVGFVVMYNLGLLSYMEKIRQIATLKVLGFSTPKIRWILQQQNLALTGIGTLLGLPLGVELLFVLLYDPSPNLDYLYRPTMGPFVFSVVFTFGISVVVNAYLTSKVKDIDMVEALKGVE